MPKTQTSPVQNDATPGPDAITAVKPARIGSTEPVRTASTFTTHSEAPNHRESVNGGLGANSETTADWGSYGPSSAGQGGLEGGFGSIGNQQANVPGAAGGRSLGGGRVTNKGAEETVTVTLLPEKEGMFMFQHHNYEVKSVRRGGAVIRRYSDFVWLLDCLHKRYPFRQLPLLPPKRVAGKIFSPLRSSKSLKNALVNGRHLSSDVAFMEKRRRGLVRFLNALVRHPILSHENLVVMFLTVPTVSLPSAAAIKLHLICSTRSLQYGESRLRSQYKTNSQIDFSRRSSKTLCQKIFPKRLTPFAQAYANQQTTTSVSAIFLSALPSVTKVLQPTIYDSPKL